MSYEEGSDSVGANIKVFGAVDVRHWVEAVFFVPISIIKEFKTSI